ncbi:hypothetical protein BDD12DRAFT_889869 [Trichophaea hybrida]|nr:hypothetical protein BDD12DRAFT_889869 [Trichophaea hybrida]
MAPTTRNSTNSLRCQVKGDVCCRPADWTDIAKFFIANYFAHAFTVVTPGARHRDTICFMVWALFMLYVGVARACVVITRCSIRVTGALNKAHKAGALYTLVKLTKNEDEEISAEPKKLTNI